MSATTPLLASANLLDEIAEHPVISSLIKDCAIRARQDALFDSAEGYRPSGYVAKRTWEQMGFYLGKELEQIGFKWIAQGWQSRTVSLDHFSEPVQFIPYNGTDCKSHFEYAWEKGPVTHRLVDDNERLFNYSLDLFPEEETAIRYANVFIVTDVNGMKMAVWLVLPSELANGTILRFHSRFQIFEDDFSQPQSPPEKRDADAPVVIEPILKEKGA